LRPVARQTPESNPKHPVQGRQQWPLSLSLKGGDLHSERRVFDGHGLMAAKKQSNESKDEQQKHWHLSNPSYHDPSSSTGYERIEYWRTTADTTEALGRLSVLRQVSAQASACRVDAGHLRLFVVRLVSVYGLSC
jgi:hypothetical protein